MGSISEGIILSVLLGETHSHRFEQFCNDLICDIEGGLPIVPTSVSWDLGRDGRDASGRGVFVCATLEAKIERKSTDDIKRLAANASKISRVYFCSAKQLSEKQCSEVEASLRTLLPPEVIVIVHGARQLGSLVLPKLEILSRHYRAEIDECVSLLRDGVKEVTPQEEALRLSLMTVGSEASGDIRRSLYFSVLRSVLSVGPRNIAECARDVSARLHLQRGLPPEVLEQYLGELSRAGEVSQEDGRYHLTAEGEERLAASEREAAAQMITGRLKLRAALSRSLGHALIDDHFDRLWVVIRQKMSQFFYSRGRQMVEEIGRLLNDQSTTVSEVAEPKPPLFFIDELAQAVAATTTHPDQKEELLTAMKDIFTERSGPAFEWLASVCAAFVAVCSLGLEATTGRTIGRMIASIALVLDTDVVLSLLNRGEPDHESVDAIVKRWRVLRGQLLVGEPVLHEVAHHAWIAENDFHGVRGFLPGTPEDRIRLIENSFVRGFAEIVAAGQARLTHWPTYIRQYKGSSEWDVRRIAETLHEDYSIGVLPRATGAEGDLEKRVRTYLERIVQSSYSGRELTIARDKAYRDAALYASLVKYYRTLRQDNSDGMCLLVSSAYRLEDIENQFAELGEPHMVISIGMAVYLLSLVPEVSIGIGALGSLLFDSHLTQFHSGMERVVLRVIRESPEVDLPWGKRFLLMREVRRKLLNNAKAAGTPTRSSHDKEKVFRSALTKRSAPRTAEVLRDALDAVAADSRSKREAAALRQRVKVLEKELLKARERPAKPRKGARSR